MLDCCQVYFYIMKLSTEMIVLWLKKHSKELLLSSVTVCNILMFVGQMLNIQRTGTECSIGDEDNLQGKMSLLESSMSNQEEVMVLSGKSIEIQHQQLTLVSGSLTNYITTDSFSANYSLGVNYIRYGHSKCPNTATLVYDGVIGNSKYNQVGGGLNYLCLTRDPNFLSGSTSGFQTHSYIYGVEYEAKSPVVDSAKANHDALCALCEVKIRSQKLMIPGKNTCPSGWTQEYHGLLMAEENSNTKSDFICVDSAMETLIGGSGDENSGQLYVVEAVCGSLPCPPYIDGYEITCVVCTK